MERSALYMLSVLLEQTVNRLRTTFNARAKVVTMM